MPPGGRRMVDSVGGAAKSADAPVSGSTLVERAVERLGPLPVLGGTVAAVQAMAASEVATTSDLVGLIERDEAFAANLLRFARSAALARPVPASSVREAVVYVGRRALGRLALEAATYHFLQQFPGTGRQSRGQLHIHSLAVAGCAAACAEAVGVDVESVHLAALLHDVGKLVLPLAVGEHTAQQIALTDPAGIRRAKLERDAFGIDHAEAGAVLAAHSSASPEVVTAIAFHHGGPGEPVAPSPEAACVQVGNAIVAIPAGIEPDRELLQTALARLGLSESALDELAQGAVPHPRTPGGQPVQDRIVELERLAHTDELTGLANRRAFLARVAADLERDLPGCLMIVDVDHFKALNDRRGHLAGDRVLMSVAHVLAAHPLAGRLGGDEFAIWTPGRLEKGMRLADEICNDLHARTAPAAGGATLSVSIGVAAAPAHGTTTSALLAAADAALYRAKAAGRGQAASAPRDAGEEPRATA